jgi:hypothetical protein
LGFAPRIEPQQYSNRSNSRHSRTSSRSSSSHARQAKRHEHADVN